MNWLWVGLGGMIGSMLRYGIGQWAASAFTKTLMPIGLITVNVVGCLLIGMAFAIIQLKHGIRPEVALFIMVGFLGGFTTFSSFGLATFDLLRHQQIATAIWNIVIQVGLGSLAVWFGYWLLSRWV